MMMNITAQDAKKMVYNYQENQKITLVNTALAELDKIEKGIRLWANKGVDIFFYNLSKKMDKQVIDIIVKNLENAGFTTTLENGILGIMWHD